MTAVGALTTRIRQLPIISKIEEIVAAELGGLVGTAFFPAALREGHLSLQTSVISLSLIADGMQFQLGLGIDAKTSDTLAEILLGGDTSPDAIADALREMANSAGGALRRAAFVDGLDLALDLPSNEDLFATTMKRRREFAIVSADGLYLECLVTASKITATRVTLAELREGMITATDIEDALGDIVVPAGTRLTAASIVELRSGGVAPGATFEIFS